MIHLSPRDYRMEKIEIPDGTCYWEPQGNGHYYTTCGKLVFKRDYKEKGITHCHICKKPILAEKKDAPQNTIDDRP